MSYKYYGIYYKTDVLIVILLVDSVYTDVLIVIVLVDSVYT